MSFVPIRRKYFSILKHLRFSHLGLWNNQNRISYLRYHWMQLFLNCNLMWLYVLSVYCYFMCINRLQFASVIILYFNVKLFCKIELIKLTLWCSTHAYTDTYTFFERYNTDIRNKSVHVKYFWCLRNSKGHQIRETNPRVNHSRFLNMQYPRNTPQQLCNHDNLPTKLLLHWYHC